MLLKEIQENMLEDLKSKTISDEMIADERRKEEIERMQFDVRIDGRTQIMMLFMNIPLLIIAIKAFGLDIYKFVYYNQPFQFNLVEYVLLGLIVAIFVFATVCAFAMRFVSVPKVRGSMLHYDKKAYHYSEITHIKISSRQVMQVFVAKKRLFSLTRDFVNYESFLVWAGKCNIKIEKDPPMELSKEQIEKMTIIIVLMIGVLVGVLYAIGGR